MALKFGDTGVRGTYKELTPGILLRLSEAFATYLKNGPIAVAADTRPSGIYMLEAIISGLMACGTSVYNFGILPTPILQWIIPHESFVGAITVSGGHNEFEWNALNFINNEGAYLTPIEVEEYFNIFHSRKYARKRFHQLGKHEKSSRGLDTYFSRLRSKSEVTAPLKFVIDCAAGSTSTIVKRLGESLNIDFIPLFDEDVGSFIKDPEPNRRNAQVLSTVVSETATDGGFLLDSDGTRILVVDEKGRILSEEMTLPLFARILLEKDQSHIVTTYSTSNSIDEIAGRFKVKTYRSDVGPPSVLQKVRELKAHIGGEGSGSVMYTPFSYGYDSFFFIKVLSDYLRENKVTISQLAAEIREPEIIKETIELPPEKIYDILNRIERMFPKKINLKDGFYINNRKGWFCIRAASTVSRLRIIGEGEGIRDKIDEIIETLL